MGCCECMHVPEKGAFTKGREYRWSFCIDGVSVPDDSGNRILFDEISFLLNFKRIKRPVDPANKCEGCEYGDVYIVLCPCPVCKTENLLGNVRTRMLHCRNGCTERPGFPLAADFCGKQNCWEDVSYRSYRIVIYPTAELKQMQMIGRFFHVSIARIYQRFRKGEAVQMDFHYSAALTLQEYLDREGLRYETDPALPVYPRFKECWQEQDF